MFITEKLALQEEHSILPPKKHYTIIFFSLFFLCLLILHLALKYENDFETYQIPRNYFNKSFQFEFTFMLIH